MLALALVAALLGRGLASVLIDIPAALWAVPLLGAGLLLARRSATAAVLAVLALLAVLAGVRVEASGPQPRGAAVSGPIIGVHPRQAVAVRIDGYGPHDIVVDDYVDPPGGLGYDPLAWSRWLETELHAIADTHYAEGPARARAAFGQARVELSDGVVPPAELGAYESLLGFTVHSGTIGEGSRVEFVCPGQAQGPRRGVLTQLAAIGGGCPRKYLVDGSTGLGVSPRFPGYTQIRGRDRLRLATALGWPSGDPRQDRRTLALEAGLVLLLVLLMAVISVALALRIDPHRSLDRNAPVLAGVGVLVVFVAALAEPAPASAASEPGSVWLGIAALMLLPDPADSTSIATSTSDRSRPALQLALLVAATLALIGASPLAGTGDAVALAEAITEAITAALPRQALVWEQARALAGGACVLGLGAGLNACVSGLAAVREREHAPDWLRRWIGPAALLLVGVALSLRKPVDDLALLHGAVALLIASSVAAATGVRRWLLALLCSGLAAAPVIHAIALASVLDRGLGLLGWAACVGSAIACLVLVLGRSGEADRAS